MGGNSLHSRVIGEGVSVLIIHGWKLDGNTEAVDLEPIFTTSAGFKRIYIDLPGMGSTPAAGIQNLDDIYQRLVHFIDCKIKTERFLLIGSSCGAYLARALAYTYRRQLDGLLLRVPMVEADTSKRDIDPFSPLISDAEVIDGLSPAERHLSDCAIVQTPEFISALRSRCNQGLNAAVEAADDTALDAIREDTHRYRLSSQFLPGPAKFFAPALILCGRQDATVGYRDAIKLFENYARATFVVLDRETHLLPTQDRTVFNALVLDWLNRVIEWQAYRVE